MSAFWTIINRVDLMNRLCYLEQCGYVSHGIFNGTDEENFNRMLSFSEEDCIKMDSLVNVINKCSAEIDKKTKLLYPTNSIKRKSDGDNNDNDNDAKRRK